MGVRSQKERKRTDEEEVAKGSEKEVGKDVTHGSRDRNTKNNV